MQTAVKTSTKKKHQEEVPILRSRFSRDRVGEISSQPVPTGHLDPETQSETHSVTGDNTDHPLFTHICSESVDIRDEYSVTRYMSVLADSPALIEQTGETLITAEEEQPDTNTQALVVACVRKSTVMAKLQGFEFWNKTLKAARFVVAPMVDQSELAWRLLSRRHGAQLCYTPMLHAQVFVRDANYRRENLYNEVCEEDRPLITQFCANDPDVFLEAALLAQDYCDAIDLNLGCPQMIAKRGHYGAFLQDEWELLEKMIKLANENLSVPITCKIRVFKEIEKTVAYAQMLERAGCQLLTVHGRTKDQKGAMTGIASWEHIKAVRQAVNIPVFANGNIQHLSDVERCIQETGVQGVMSAEGNLHNPALFEGRNPPVWEMAEEYLEVVKQHPPCTLSYVRAHLFKLWHHTLQLHHDLREELAKVKNLEGLADVSKKLRLRCQEEIAKGNDVEEKESSLPFCHWICQPYVRPMPKEPVANGKSQILEVKKAVCQKRALEDSDGSAEMLSKNKQKKRSRNPNKNFCPDQKPKYIKCEQCGNPKGNKCVFNLCRGCCKKKSYKEVADCPSHGLRFKTKAEKQKAEEDNRKESSAAEMEKSSNSPHPSSEQLEQSQAHLLL